MTKYFFDFGSHNGQTIEKARPLFPDVDFFIGFEPVHELYIQAVKKSAAYRNTLYFNYAVDTLEKNCFATSTIYEDLAHHKLGSSLLPDKYVKRKVSKEVLCADVVFLFNILTKPEDEIVLKIDIEGKEYDVLEKLLNSGILKERVKKLYVEWHWNKTSSISRERHETLVKKLQTEGYDITGDRKIDEFYVGM